MAKPNEASAHRVQPVAATKTKRPNRSQIQAMEARSVTPLEPFSLSPDPVGMTMDAVVAAPNTGVLPARRSSRSRTANRIIPLTREEEYSYIREEMRRLLIIGACLLALMFILLFVIDTP